MKSVTVKSNWDKGVCSSKLPGLWKCCILVREECVCGDFGVCGVGGVCEQCILQVGMVEPGEEPPGERSSSHSLWKQNNRLTAPVGRTSSEPEPITGQEQEVTRRRSEETWRVSPQERQRESWSEETGTSEGTNKVTIIIVETVLGHQGAV